MNHVQFTDNSIFQIGRDPLRHGDDFRHFRFCLEEIADFIFVSAENGNSIFFVCSRNDKRFFYIAGRIGKRKRFKFFTLCEERQSLICALCESCNFFIIRMIYRELSRQILMICCMREIGA